MAYTQSYYEIIDFSDGHITHSAKPNRWLITGEPRPGKVSLMNTEDHTCISSLSAWKIVRAQ